MAIGAAKVGAATGGNSISTTTVALPVGWAEGDEMRLSVSSQGHVLHAVPAGWALVAEAATGRTTATTLLSVFRKRAVAGEVDVVVNFTDSAGVASKCAANAVINAWAGVDATTPDDVAAATAVDTASSLAHVAPALAPVTAGARYVTVPARGGTASTATPPTGHTELVEAASFNRSHTVGEEDRPTAGDTGTRTWVPSASGPYCAVSMALRPASDAAAPISVAIDSLILALATQSVTPAPTTATPTVDSLPMALAPQALAPSAPAIVAVGTLALALAPQALAPSPGPASPSLESLALLLAAEAITPVPTAPAPLLASLALLLTPQDLGATAGAVAPVVALDTLMLALTAQPVIAAPSPASVAAASLLLALAPQALSAAPSPLSVAVASLTLALAAQPLGASVAQGPLSVALASLVLVLTAQQLDAVTGAPPLGVIVVGDQEASSATATDRIGSALMVSDSVTP